MDVSDLYTDGGCLGRNPSPLGGTWAFVFVAPDGQRVREASGVLTVEECGLDAVSNNVTELLAAVEGMEALPAGWVGTIHTDSEITSWRIRPGRQAKLNGVPQWLAERLTRAKGRLGAYQVRLLGGHPSRKDLVRGYRETGRRLPVSVHNLTCDRLCSEAAQRFLQQKTSV